MKPWPIFSLLLLVQQPMAHGQGAQQQLENGEAALDSGVWEIAELHFRNLLADPSLALDKKPHVIVRLAETLIREGNAAEALELLGQSVVSQHPEVAFWKAQALTSQRRFNEAIQIFSTLLSNPDARHRTEAGFTQASLQLALDQPDAALTTLSNLTAECDPATLTRIRLYQVEIFMDLGRLDDARRAMPEIASTAAQDRPAAEFLEARLQLQQGHPAVAEAGFQTLVNRSLTGRQGLPLVRHHLAVIGLADSIKAQGDGEAAARSLVDFIQEHPDSPLLEAMFSRILEWLPEKPTATDPILERIAQWIPESTLRFPPLLRPAEAMVTPPATDTTAVSAWPVSVESGEQKELLTYSLYTRAMGLHRLGTPMALAESRSLLNRMRVESPDHFLTSRALYNLARWRLEEGFVDVAFSILETLRETAKAPALKGQSAFLEARISYTNGDPAKATLLFEEAAKSLTGGDLRVAKLYRAISMFRTGITHGTQLIQSDGNPPDKELEADLALEQALSTTPAEAQRTALDGFLTKFRDHPRAAEARLAAAEAALAGQTPDVSFAGAQLDALTATPEKAAGLPAARLALARLRFADLSKDSAGSIAAAQVIMDAYPNQPEAAEAAFVLGRRQFQAGSYNAARLVLEKLAAADNDPVRVQAAWLLAARSAALGGTEASKKEALILFDKTIEGGGPVTGIAVLEKSRHLIDLARSNEAVDQLRDWLAKLPADDPLRLPSGLLLGEALSAQGESNPGSRLQALAVYDTLLDQAKSRPALLNRLQYLRGRTLELIPEEKDPTKRREKQAFQVYYSVLETTTPPEEWEYFELCGFRALELLEKAGRWRPAINVATKIASFKGPRAEEAASRASEIQLKQMIYEDN
jgi:tetratricopeptide (TPR) repeat protein